MDKKRLEIIVTIGLVIIFIFAMSNSIKKIWGRFQAAPRPAAVSGAVSPANAPVAKLMPPMPKDIMSPEAAPKLSWARCPFSGKLYTAKEVTGISGLKLSGIVWDAKNPQALINSRVVQQGDTINHFVVIKISNDKVTLGQGDKYFELKLER